MLKMTINDEEVVSKNDFTIKEEMQSASSTILNNTYPKSWEQDKDYTSRFYYPKDYAKLNIQNFTRVQEAEAGTTVQINGSATLTDVDTTKNSRVMKLLGQTSQSGTPTPDSPQPVNVVSGDNVLSICGKNLFNPQKAIIDSNSIGVYITSDNEWIRFKTRTIERIYYYPTNIEENKQYTFKTTLKSATSSTNNVIFYAMYTDGTNSQLINETTTDTNEHTSYGTTTSGKTLSYIMSGNTNAIETFLKIEGTQLEQNTQPTTYEPYIGNTYPIYLGVENLLKNIYHENDDTYTTNGITFTKNSDGSITANGTATSTARYDFVESSNRASISAGDYMLTGCPSGGGSSTYRLVMGITGVGEKYDIGTGNQINISTDTTYYFIIQIMTGITVNNLTFYPMLQKGTKVNHYTPYGTTPIELCKIGNYQDSIYKGVGSNLLQLSVLNVSANTTTDLQIANNLPIGTYNFNGSGIVGDGRFNLYGIDINDTQEYLLQNQLTKNIGEGYSFTTTKIYKAIKIYTNVALSGNIQLSEGTTPLPYEPYNSKDKWLLHKEIGKVVLDGTNKTFSAQMTTSGTGEFRYRIDNTGCINATSGSTLVQSYCNRLIAKTSNNTYSRVQGVAYNDNNNQLIVFIDDIKTSTLEQANNWLKNNNTTIYYILATPTTTQITDTTLISQLDNLESS